MKNYLFMNVNVSLQVPVPDGKTAKEFYSSLTYEDILDLMKVELTENEDPHSFIDVYSVDEFMEEDSKAFIKAEYWVVATGIDCDGFNSGHIYTFVDYDAAFDFAKSLSEGSDGLSYGVIDNIEDLKTYCLSFNKDYKNYLTINQ
jgi:Mg2+ and Co2+ transporter CorA